MAIDAQLLLQIDASTEILRQEVARAVNSVETGSNKMDASLNKIDKTFFNLGKSAGDHLKQISALGIAYLGLSSIKDAISSSIDYASSLGETSQQLGVTTKFLQEYRFAATQSGASTEQADKAIGKFSITVGKAREGNGQAQAAFASLGISLDDLAHNTTDELFSKVADAIAKVPDPARQAAEAVALFGKGGQAIIPVLQGGSQGFNEFAAAAQKAGLVLSSETINKLDELHDKGDAVRQVISVQLAAAIGANADAILRLGQAAAGAIGSVGGFFQRMQGLRNLIDRGGPSAFFQTAEADTRAADPQSLAQDDFARLTAARKSAAGAQTAYDNAVGSGQYVGADSRVALKLASAKDELAKATAFALESAKAARASIALPDIATGKSDFDTTPAPGPKEKTERAKKEKPGLTATSVPT